MPTEQEEIKINHYLSLVDLCKLDACNLEQCGFDSTHTMESILWDNGMDINKPFRLIFDSHRSLTGGAVRFFRYVGVFRTDEEWVELYGVDEHFVASEMEELKYYGADVRVTGRTSFPETTATVSEG